VTALAAESRSLGAAVPRGTSLAALPEGMLVAVSGMGWTAATQGAQGLIDAGATALASFGLAGGLDPALPAGALVLPREVISPEGTRWPVAWEWREQLACALTSVRTVSAGNLLSCREPLVSAIDKAAAFRATAAVAVDMESVAIAEVAARHRLPFIAVRAIVDTAADSLPPSLTAAAAAAGAVRMGRLIGALLRAPRELAALIRLVPRYRAAQRTLVAVARCGALAPVGQRSAAALA
jgi:adenosylhomocysteine nucleosidase